MKPAVWALAVVAAAPLWVQAAESPAAPKDDGCLMLNNRILGPRTENRPLPLLRGDPEHGFTPACSATWNTLSPNNQPLSVEACFRGSLLQVPNDSACGPKTGKLWIGTRWVITSVDLAQGTEHAAVCQQLETGAWAGTRAFSFECKPKTRELSDGRSGHKPEASTPPPAEPAKPAPPEPPR